MLLLSWSIIYISFDTKKLRLGELADGARKRWRKKTKRWEKIFLQQQLLLYFMGIARKIIEYALLFCSLFRTLITDGITNGCFSFFLFSCSMFTFSLSFSVSLYVMWEMECSKQNFFPLSYDGNHAMLKLFSFIKVQWKFRFLSLCHSPAGTWHVHHVLFTYFMWFRWKFKFSMKKSLPPRRDFALFNFSSNPPFRFYEFHHKLLHI